MANRKIRIAYRVVLVLLTIGILFSAVPGVLELPYAVAHFTQVLKLPEYLLGFISGIKLMGLVALYLPGFYKLKEWVFAGFMFDLIGAWFCNFAATGSFVAAMPVLIYIALLLLLYKLYNKVRAVAVAS
ncbi:MAG: DoxX family protein [Flavipsychrobacter sp.]|nr:DoxX family protein [Flavipsychrobacter sp.]